MQNRIDKLIKTGIENPKEFDLTLTALQVAVKADSDEKKQLLREFHESLKGKGEEIKALTVREQLEDIADVISLSYIAQHYFGKSRQWLNHRLHENTINGKTVKFTPEQISTLNQALKDIGQRIGSLNVI